MQLLYRRVCRSTAIREPPTRADNIPLFLAECGRDQADHFSLAGGFGDLVHTTDVYVCQRSGASPSIGPYDDYLNMDVTQLVQDMIQNSQSSYGFEFALLDEHYYSSLVFTSSDAADPSRYPKLEICYSITNGLQPMNSNATEPRVFPNPVGDRAQLSYDPTVYSDAVLNC